MKTPLQELIDTIKERKGNENSMPFMWNGDIIKLAESLLEKEKEQRGYTKEDVLKAGEMGEINHHDTKHIVSYLDEARDFNETYGGNK